MHKRLTSFIEQYEVCIATNLASGKNTLPL